VVVAVSATTRSIRPGERDGVDYHFMSEADFAAAVATGAFVEHVEYAGNRYGTLRSELDRNLAGGRSVVVEIELQGARAVRRALPDAVSIFIAPPSMAELARRLETRATERADDIARRLAVGEVEIQAMGEFEHRVVNADVDAAAAELLEVMSAALAPGTTAEAR
jgi:guanylate kinase